MKNELNIEMGKIRVCPVCGKKFIPTVGWLYKSVAYPRKVYCSYTCWRSEGGDGNNKKFRSKPTKFRNF